MKPIYILPLAALALTCVSCEDDMMDWGRPAEENPVSISEIPLSVQEQINNYDYLKNYVELYRSRVGQDFLLGLGLGADSYINDSTYRRVSIENFQMFTAGNAMKHQSMVKSNGTIDFTTFDAFCDIVGQDAKIYGHNFIWHTQQQQSYLKSLIAPEMKIQQTGGGSGIVNVLPADASNFDGGTTGGWGSWGDAKGSVEVSDGGVDGTMCIKLTCEGGSAAYKAQFAYTFDQPLDMEKTYSIKFEAKSSIPGGKLQFAYQNGSTYGSQGGYTTFEVGTSWVPCEVKFQPQYDDVNRILINFGEIDADYYIDNIEFGEFVEAEEEIDPMVNVIAGANSSFETEDASSLSWGNWGNESTKALSEKGKGNGSDYCLVLTNPTEGADYYVAQLAFDLDEPLKVGVTYVMQFDAKCATPGSSVQTCAQNSSNYSGGFYQAHDLATEWLTYTAEMTVTEDKGFNRILINFGKVADTFYIDNVKFGEKIEQASDNKATVITFVPKSAEEKKAALLGAMEDWIGTVFSHINGDTRFVAWDVINEPVSDGGGLRGINGVFGTGEDSEPVENETEGLKLNWESSAGNAHFYWGYYMGKEYGCRAFELARKHADANGLPDMKLYVNDYNLETNPTKLQTLIDFVKYIDENNATGQPIVDGIGTQMHIQSSISREEIDAMFRTMAATGKLVRVTELDVAVGTSTPSADKVQEQANTYKNVFESYFENVPEAQRAGITIWTLSDATEEHEYWLNGDTPNLFNADLSRKLAYKSVCDAIAGKDLGAELSGEDWQNRDYKTRTDDEEAAKDAADEKK